MLYFCPFIKYRTQMVLTVSVWMDTVILVFNILDFIHVCVLSSLGRGKENILLQNLLQNLLQK